MTGIDQVKKVLSAEMDKASEQPNFKTTSEMMDGLLNLYRNPDVESGDPMKWVNVDLVLKPEMYLLTGIPSSGKSTWLDNVMMNSIADHRYKWGVFSPESHPIELHMKQLIEIYTHTNFYGAYNYTRTSEQHIEGFVRQMHEHLIMMTPTEDNLTIEALLELMQYLVDERGLNAFILDPYNEFSHTRPSSMSETEYVSRFLGKVRAFINKNNVMVWIVAHPTKLRKEDITLHDGTTAFDYPVPTAYDIAGSANFFNKPDVIVAVHRDKDKERNPDNHVSINVQKVRRKTTGKLGAYWLKFNYNDGTYVSV